MRALGVVAMEIMNDWKKDSKKDFNLDLISDYVKITQSVHIKT